MIKREDVDLSQLESAEFLGELTVLTYGDPGSFDREYGPAQGDPALTVTDMDWDVWTCPGSVDALFLAA
jgi:hypothetical protein